MTGQIAPTVFLPTAFHSGDYSMYLNTCETGGIPYEPANPELVAAAEAAVETVREQRRALRELAYLAATAAIESGAALLGED